MVRLSGILNGARQLIVVCHILCVLGEDGEPFSAVCPKERM